MTFSPPPAVISTPRASKSFLSATAPKLPNKPRYSAQSPNMTRREVACDDCNPLRVRPGNDSNHTRADCSFDNVDSFCRVGVSRRDETSSRPLGRSEHGDVGTASAGSWNRPQHCERHCKFPPEERAVQKN